MLLAFFALAVQGLESMAAWQGNPFAQVPIEDAAVAWERAGEIAAGDWVGERPFLSAPLHLWMLGLVRLVGGGIPAALGIQTLLHALTVLVVGLAASRRFGNRAGTLAALAYLALAGPAFFAGRLLNLPLQLLLVALVDLQAFRCTELPSKRNWALLGIAIGLLSLAAPPFLLAIPLLAWWALKWGGGGKRGAALTLATGLAVLAPATLHNFAACGEFIPVSAQAGVTFHHGNGPGAVGVYHPIAGVSASRLHQNPDAFRLAAEGGGASGWKSSSQWFLRQGLDWMWENPGQACALWVKKATWTLTGSVYGDVYLPALEREDGLPGSGALRISLVLFLPIALMGLVWQALRKGRAAFPQAILLLIPLVVCVVFFYSPRYRLPAAIPAVILLGGALGAGIARMPGRMFLPALALGAFSFAGARVAGFETPSIFRPQFEHSLGAALRIQGKNLEAVDHLQEAIRLGYSTAPAHYDLAQALMRLERWKEAETSLRATLKINPEHNEAALNLKAVASWLDPETDPHGP